MTRFKTIYSPNSAFGGFEFRITGNGERFNVQQRSPAAQRFTTALTLDKKEFDSFMTGISHDSGNPAYVSRLID